MRLSRRIGMAFLVLAGVTAAGTIGYRILLGASWLDCLYMTVITISTVGYGEVVPGMELHPEARVFTMLLILFGAGVLLYVLSTLTAFFVEGELRDILRRRKMERKIDALCDHVIVCGCGTTGIHVVKELLEVGTAFVVLERNDEILSGALERHPFLYVQADATEDDVLLNAGIERAKGIVTLLPTDRDNLYVTFTARQLNPSIRIVSRGVEPRNRDKIRRAGADAVVYPNQIGGLRMVSQLIRPEAVTFLDRMLRPGKGVWRISEVEVDPGSPAEGRTLGSLDIPHRVGIPVLALSRGEGGSPTYYPPSDTVLEGGSRLVVLAENRHLQDLRRVIREG